MSNSGEMALDYQRGNTDALLPLWTQVQRLAAKMVKRYAGLARQNGAIDFEDLLQAAFLGVERAAIAYVPEKGGFTTIMGYYVQHEMNKLLGLGGRVRREHYDSVSVNMPIGENGTATLGDLLPDTTLPDEDRDMLQEDMQREVRAAIGRLKEAQAQAVRACCLEGASYDTVAEQMGLVPSRVGQLKAKGIQMLRRDKRLQELAVVAVPFRYMGVDAFRREWTSTVEWAVMERERMREEAARRGWPEAGRQW